MCVIANPVSGRGRGDSLGRSLQERLLERGHEVTYSPTQRPRHAVELARQAVASGHAVVAAVGGDGTVSECAEGLVGAACRLAVVPTGTGNDLVRTLGIRSDTEAAAEAIDRGRTRRLDAWHLNDRIFVNVAGVGFDAEVAASLGEGGRRVGGAPAYVAGVLATLGRYRPRFLQMRVDGAEFSGRVMMVALANARYYGGGMMIAPDADPADGLLDVILIQEVPKIRFLTQFPRVFRGTHLSDPAVKTYRGASVTIDGDSTTRVSVDGEPCGTLPIRVTPVEPPLSVIVP